MPITENDLAGLYDGDVISTSGEKIGSIGQIYLDDQTGEPSFVTANTGLFGTSQSFVPMRGARAEDGNIVVTFDKTTVKDAPRIDDDGSLSPAEEDELYAYYGMSRNDADAADYGLADQAPEPGESSVGGPAEGGIGVATGTGTAAGTLADDRPTAATTGPDANYPTPDAPEQSYPPSTDPDRGYDRTDRTDTDVRVDDRTDTDVRTDDRTDTDVRTNDWTADDQRDVAGVPNDRDGYTEGDRPGAFGGVDLTPEERESYAGSSPEADRDDRTTADDRTTDGDGDGDRAAAPATATEAPAGAGGQGRLRKWVMTEYQPVESKEVIVEGDEALSDQPPVR